MAVGAGLVLEAATVGAGHDEAAAREAVGKVLDALGHDRVLAEGRVGVDAVGEVRGRAVAAHVPQVGVYVEGHLDAVAAVPQRANRAAPVELKVARHHVLVVLEATTRHHDAVVRADLAGLAVLLNLDTDDGLGLGVLDELGAAGVVPEVDVGLRERVVAVDLEQLAVEADADGESLALFCAFVLGELAGFDGVAESRVAQAVPVDAHVVDQSIGKGYLAVDEGGDDVLVVGTLAVQRLVILDKLLAVSAGAHDLRAVAAVAAGLPLGGDVEKQHAGTLTGGVDGRGQAGEARAHDDDVVLAVPWDGVGIGAGRGFGGEGRDGDGGRSDAEGGTGKEGPTSNLSHGGNPLCFKGCEWVGSHPDVAL